MSFEILSELTFNETVTLKNGKQFPAQVTVAIDYETDPVSDQIAFGNTEEDKQAERDYIARFERGELLNLVVRVEAKAFGIIGTDYLGGVHARAKHLNDDIREMVADHGMDTNAISDLVSQVLELANNLTGFAS